MSGALGKYKVEARLGGGGMAEVFSSSVVGADGFVRGVAIKRVLPEFAGDVQFVELFMAEAQIGARLAHPNIVSVIDLDHDVTGDLFIVMELVTGCDLATLAAAGLLPYPVIIHVIAEVLRGLGFAHDLPLGGSIRGVVHRDVSPQNVLLSWQGDVKVTDFGIAKVREATQASASVHLKGKPAYMSPEQASGQPLDGRSDLFAVGVMCWELLVGKQLFAAEDLRGTLAAVLFGNVPPPRQLRRTVPKDLERVVMKLLERDLAARYLTAEAALAELLVCADAPRDGRGALRDVLAGYRATGGRHRRSPLERQEVTSAATVVGSRSRAKPAPRRGALTLALVMVVLAFTGAALAFGLSRKPEREATPGTETDAVAARTVVDVARVDAAAIDAPATGLDVDLSELGPECAAYTRVFERLATCPSLTQAARDGYQRGLKLWRAGLGNVRDYPGRRAMENVCKDGIAILTKGISGC